MIYTDNLIEGARNLLINCAELTPNETLVIISEDPDLGWYDYEITNVLYNEAERLGVKPTLLKVSGPDNKKNLAVIHAVEIHDCTIFLSRIGDQDRFEVPVHGKKIIMCYTRTAEMLSSDYGRAHHHALLELKQAINNVLLAAEYIHISCSNGTNLTIKVSETELESNNDVFVRRFPMGVHQPLSASMMSGQVALANFITPTGSKVYEPASVKVSNIVLAYIKNGIISDLSGNPEDVNKIREHYKMVAKKFNITSNNVLSFHAGIHPGCKYLADANDNPDHWANTVFTNPRILHFHTCGNYAGEVSWQIIDHTLTVNNRNLWQDGRLCVSDFEQTRQCLNNWPILQTMFSNPAQNIGL